MRGPRANRRRCRQVESDRAAARPRSRARLIRATATIRKEQSVFEISACRTCFILALLMSVSVTIAAVTRREALAALLAAPLWQVRSLYAQTNDLTALTIAEASRRLASRSITPLQLTNAYLP